MIRRSKFSIGYYLIMFMAILLLETMFFSGPVLHFVFGQAVHPSQRFEQRCDFFVFLAADRFVLGEQLTGKLFVVYHRFALSLTRLRENKKMNRRDAESAEILTKREDNGFPSLW